VKQTVLECRRLAGFPGGDTSRPLLSTSINELPFKEIWAVDFEFGADPGENPDPVCLVALELRSGRKVRLWQDELGPMPPYPTGPDTLFVAYYASAEIGYHLSLGWPVPERILGLFIEFRNAANGLPTPSGFGLIGALVYHGLDAIGTEQRRKCVNLPFEAALGHRRNVLRSSIIVRAMSMLWRDCCRRCWQRSIFPERYIAVGTWRRPHEWSEPESRSTRLPWGA
jgi:hypothetical protein